MRKTLDRAKILEIANNRLAAPSNHINTIEARFALISFLETILMEHDSYRGFGYLTSEMLDDPDEAPGINHKPDEFGNRPETFEEKFNGTDSSRRVYV